MRIWAGSLAGGRSVVFLAEDDGETSRPQSVACGGLYFGGGEESPFLRTRIGFCDSRKGHLQICYIIHIVLSIHPTYRFKIGAVETEFRTDEVTLRAHDVKARTREHICMT